MRGKEKSHNIHTHRGAKTIHTYISDKSFAIFRKMLQLLVFISLVCFFSEIKLSNFTRQKSFRQTGLPNSNENFCFRYFQPFSLFISPQLLSSYRFRYLSLALCTFNHNSSTFVLSIKNSYLKEPVYLCECMWSVCGCSANKRACNNLVYVEFRSRKM